MLSRLKDLAIFKRLLRQGSSPGNRRKSNRALTRLRQDHTDFTFLLLALEHQLGLPGSARDLDIKLARAILTYFSKYATLTHHPIENLIYGHLICHEPTLSHAAFSLIEEHQAMARHAAELREEFERFEPGNAAALTRLVSLANTFIERERAHIALEETTLFPKAELLLSFEQWREIDLLKPNQRRNEKLVADATESLTS